ncbi:Clavaminate synthase-like protein [Rhizodiscina lignyota]|uniref:Clavaminate synthase-like protein n=1 Tax=Rhizodiscina lignyota TaxID=1504668 RepID=A0A9P4ITC2_9PEZI|nr:Clavaminate synthase-like protein [Rhizodiscina lignyota]
MPLIIDEDFKGIPPFPNTVSTAPLLRISLAKLLSGDAEEQDRVWKACCGLGFFYLDMRMNEDISDAGLLDGNALLDDADQLFKTGEGFFELPLEEKRKYDFSSQNSYFGYKGMGAATIDAKGNKDRNEFYNVSKDETLGVPHPPENPNMPAAPYLDQYRPLLKDYITRCHALITYFLRFLNARLELPEGKLESLHRIDAISGDQVRFIKAPPQPVDDKRTALGAHTDFGSVTVLFNRVGGLQVRLPHYIQPTPPSEHSENANRLAGEEDGENWAYVRPLPGHAIINLGDALVKFSGGILRSNIHRVSSPPDTQAETTRYSLVYFSRPEDEVLLKALDESPLVKESIKGKAAEEAVNSKDWILRRALGSRKGAEGWKNSRGTENASLAKDVEVRN